MPAAPLLALGLFHWAFTIVGAVALVLIVATLISLFRNPRISGGEKAVWVVATICFPIFGSLVYFTVRRDW